MSTETGRYGPRKGPRLIFTLAAIIGALVLALPSLSNERHIDLDDLSPAELDAALEAELGADDLWQFGIDINKAYPLKVLHEAILKAFSDEGDDDDEQVITEADLQEEMEEADTNLSDVIWEALQHADKFAAGKPASAYLRVANRMLAKEDGLTIGGVGATQSKLAVRSTILRARK